MERIKLKIKYSRLSLIAQALLQYADLCNLQSVIIDIARKEDYQIRLSVTMELYYKVQEKANKRYPAETHKLPLELHHALVLQSALLQFISNSENDFERNAIDMVKNALNLEIVSLSKTTE